MGLLIVCVPLGDGEFPRGREGRPSSPSPKASTLRVLVAEPTDMCKPGGSPRSDETIVPVRVPVEPTMSSRIGVPGPNSFRIRREALAREGRDALSLSVILPPATVQTRKTSTVRSLSAHPSPPRCVNNCSHGRPRSTTNHRLLEWRTASNPRLQASQSGAATSPFLCHQPVNATLSTLLV